MPSFLTFLITGHEWEPFFPKLECGEEGICLKVFLLLMPTDLLEEGSQGNLASDYRHILFLGGVHEEEFHVGSL